MSRKNVVISEQLWRAIKRKAFERESSIKAIVEDAIMLWLLLDECGTKPDSECLKQMIIKRGKRVIWAYRKLIGEKEVEDGQEE